MELESGNPFFKLLGYTPITNVTTHIMEEVAQGIRKLFKAI